MLRAMATAWCSCSALWHTTLLQISGILGTTGLSLRTWVSGQKVEMEKMEIDKSPVTLETSTFQRHDSYPFKSLHLQVERIQTQKLPTI